MARCSELDSGSRAERQGRKMERGARGYEVLHCATRCAELSSACSEQVFHENVSCQLQCVQSFLDAEASSRRRLHQRHLDLSVPTFQAAVAGTLVLPCLPCFCCHPLKRGRGVFTQKERIYRAGSHDCVCCLRLPWLDSSILHWRQSPWPSLTLFWTCFLF